MQNLFDKASLVMVPSGYDNGKLYNIKPEDKGSAFEFERATMATRVNSSGLVETMFPEATNLLLHSNQFDTTWLDIGSEVSSGFTSYDGSNNAWKLDENTESTVHFLLQTASVTGVNTFSIYLKAGTKNKVQLYDGTNNIGVKFNLETKSMYSTSGSGFINYNIEELNDGWARYSMTGATSSSSFRLYLLDDSYGISYTGDSANYIYIQDAQLETGYFATPYIETTTQTVTRQNQANQPRIDYTSGEGVLLLEPQRMNLVTHSENLSQSVWTTSNTYTLTANNIVSPDGTKNAYKIELPTSNGNIRYTATVSSSTGYVFSFYAKRGTAVNMNYRIYDPVNGDIVAKTSYYSQTSLSDWVRIEVPFTTGATTTSVWAYIDSDGQGNGDFYAWGVQLELGSYPTSYIPTNGQQETRAGDVCGTGGYDSVFNNSQGTLYMEFKSPTSGNSSAWINLSSGTDTDDWLFFGKDQDRLRVYLKQNNVLETSDTSTILPTNFAKTSVTYNTSSFKLNLDGVEIFDKNISPNFANNLDTLSFGSTTSTPLPEKIEVKTLCYFPEALTDEELQRLTSPSADATTFTELANNNGYTIL